MTSKFKIIIGRFNPGPLFVFKTKGHSLIFFLIVEDYFQYIVILERDLFVKGIMRVEALLKSIFVEFKVG
jgi:hypothetical protein